MSIKIGGKLAWIGVGFGVDHSTQTHSERGREREIQRGRGRERETQSIKKQCNRESNSPSPVLGVFHLRLSGVRQGCADFDSLGLLKFLVDFRQARTGVTMLHTYSPPNVGRDTTLHDELRQALGQGQSIGSTLATAKLC